MAIKQADRRVELITPLGTDALVFQRMSGSEHLGQAFEYRIEALSESTNVDLNALLGEKVAVRVDLPAGGKRYFNGYVVSAAQVPSESSRFTSFELTIRSWIWLLSQTSDCKIYQNKSVPDIVKQLFRDNGFSDFEDRLTDGSYRERDYCVQYRETDYNFVHRLMQEEGIYYYTKHEKDKHTLVLADSKGSHDKLPHYGDIPFYPKDNVSRREREHIYLWTVTRSLQSGKVVLNEFDFKIPKKNLEAKKDKSRKHPFSDLEIYDYPGEYEEIADGEAYARKRLEELQAAHEVVSATTNVHGVSPGGLFKLGNHPSKAQNKDYLITAASLSLENNPYETGASEKHTLEANLTLIDADTPFRPPRSTPKPMIRGPQTAIVVGPSGDEIHTDEHGRVKCQFHWDRYGESDENSSCWIRVSQPWSGKNWGSIAIPRIGQEVVVEYEEGDPDRPIVTGRVYNGEQKPPYELPANKTQSGMKSRSSKTGTGENFNELRFEDKKDNEQVYFHAEKDFDRVVENNDTLKVGFEKKDEGNREVEIYNNHNVKIGTGGCKDGSQTVDIYKNRTVTLATGNDKLELKKGNRDVILSLGNLSTSLKAGNQTTKLAAGKSVTQAMQSIELKVGPSSIKIDPMGITIKGPMIKIEGQTMTQIKGAMTTVDGSGMLKLGGGIIMIG